MEADGRARIKSLVLLSLFPRLKFGSLPSHLKHFLSVNLVSLISARSGPGLKNHVKDLLRRLWECAQKMAQV